MQRSIILSAAAAVLLATSATAGAQGYVNGFEVDTAGWDVFGGSFDATRVPSGNNGVPSASGDWHAEGSTAAGNWGGYSGVPGCAATACAAGSFPVHGYHTSVAVYLDVDAGFANDTRFDFTSAINHPSGAHRRDFAFNCGFYNDVVAPGGGARFVCSASNNTGRANSFPKNPAREATVIAASTGWYTFQHVFRDDGGVLAVDLSVSDGAGTVIKTWTLSDPSDVIDVTVGGNRYGWFASNELPFIAFDDTRRQDGPPPAVDHFACYSVKEKTKQDDRTVTLEDQFGLQPVVDVKKTRMLCAPVDKNGETPPMHPAFHLVCYDVKDAGDPRAQVRVSNQFGEQELEVKKAEVLCVPSLKERLD